jgi:hypothetical protein
MKTTMKKYLISLLVPCILPSMMMSMNNTNATLSTTRAVRLEQLFITMSLAGIYDLNDDGVPSVVFPYQRNAAQVKLEYAVYNKMPKLQNNYRKQKKFSHR